jgi:hypothetical protein
MEIYRQAVSQLIEVPSPNNRVIEQLNQRLCFSCGCIRTLTAFVV